MRKIITVELVVEPLGCNEYTTKKVVVAGIPQWMTIGGYSVNITDAKVIRMEDAK